MAEWRRINVADIGNVVTGKTPKTNNSDYYGGKMPFLTPSDDMSVKYVRDTKKHLTEAGKMSVKNAVIPENSICVSCIGSDLGKVVITTEETVTNQQINSIIVNGSQFDINYIYYSMVELGKILNFHSKTSTAVPIVNKSSFSQYEISCPDLYIQRKIGDVLSKLDEKIEENIKINNNLPPHPCYARIAAKQRMQTSKTDECLHTNGKVSDRGSNEETAEQFSSLLAA